MAVYVDDARHRFRGYVMSHLWADTRDELLAFVDRIAVHRKWLQEPPSASWVHFDITQTKRQFAIAAGAIQTDKYGPVEHCARLDIASGEEARVERGTRKLAQVAACREMRSA